MELTNILVNNHGFTLVTKHFNLKDREDAEPSIRYSWHYPINSYNCKNVISKSLVASKVLSNRNKTCRLNC